MIPLEILGNMGKQQKWLRILPGQPASAMRIPRWSMAIRQRTNHVGSYDLTAHFTDTSNYEVSAGVTGKEILTPKTIYAEVTGSGSDFDHIAWQVVRNPESQLVNGDQGVFQYGLGPVISRKDQLFGVDMTMNGRYPP